MRVLEIRIKSVQGVLEDFKRAYRAAEEGRTAPKREGTFFASVEAARTLLTPERVRLLALIRKHRPASIYELAKLAGRDLKNVHDDVALLERHGIIATDLEESDKNRRVPSVPYDEIRVSIPLDVVSENAANYLPSISAREEARRKYVPAKIRYLLVAESPPKDSSRYFYFEDVWRGDSLFLETMKVLYAQRYSDARTLRARKKHFLQRFKEDGFLLLDALEEPLGKIGQSEKVRKIRSALPELVRRLAALRNAHKNAKVILVSVPVYKACTLRLKREGFDIVNTEAIDFPAQGRQRLYRQKFASALQMAGWTGAGEP
ncbi:MAG TPA: hypothetical protein VGK88_03670 [bacterium]|jgi:predicted transcriptional regulator